MSDGWLPVSVHLISDVGNYHHDPIVFLVTGLRVFTTIWQVSLLMATWHCLFPLSVLILIILAAGCTDSSTENPVPTLSTLPVPRGTVVPGDVLQVFGDVSGRGIPGGTIDNITFTIGLIDIHNSISMEQLSVVYADAIRTETLHPVDGYYGDPPRGFWGIIRVEKEVGGPNNRLDNEERFVITINPTAPLVPRQMITIDVKPPGGRSLTIRRVAPPTILADNILSPL